MGLVRSRAKHLESVISICLLAILLLIGVGVFIKQFDVDMSRFGMEGATITENEAALEYLAPEGFEKLSEIEVYEAENLYEKINGKAPFYIDAGFTKLSTQRFVSEADENLLMELYIFDMARPRNAFSVYSVQRRAGAQILPAMEFAYRTSNGMYFVHGKYYIELLGSAESGELLEAMAEVAGKIRSELTVGKVKKIVELSLFPQENIVPGSGKLYLADAFGFEGLSDTFTCQYKLGDETITAFLGKRSGRSDAEAAAENYRNFLTENGATSRKAIDKSLEGKVLDFYDTIEIVLSTGPFVAGIHEAENQQSAEKLAVRLAQKLSEAANAMNND